MEGARSARSRRPEPCTVAALKEAQAAVDRRVPQIVEALDGAGLQRIASASQLHPAERMDRCWCICSSTTYHRGQGHAMPGAWRPPQLDEFFSAGEAPLRAAEFAELGWTEERIWSGPDTET
jgi:hypothetical protein